MLKNHLDELSVLSVYLARYESCLSPGTSVNSNDLVPNSALGI